jgi:hypothetical protein
VGNIHLIVEVHVSYGWLQNIERLLDFPINSSLRATCKGNVFGMALVEQGHNITWISALVKSMVTCHIVFYFMSILYDVSLQGLCVLKIV